MNIKTGVLMSKIVLSFVLLVLVLFSTLVIAQEIQADKKQLSDLYPGKAYSPYRWAQVSR